MRRLIALCLAAAAVLPACFDGDDGGDPLDPEPEPSLYSGTFYVTYSLIETSCALAPLFDGNATIAIEGDTITWGSMKGPWDDETKRGTGVSVAPTCIPIDPLTGCIACFTTSFDVIYASVDSFAGVFGASYTYSSSCENDSCHTRYSISGKRSL